MRYTLIAAGALLMTACSSTVAPPATPPSDFSGQPALSESGYAQTVVSQDFPMTRPELRAWLEADSKVIDAMNEGGEIAPPVDTVYFEGDWPETGATRRVELADGHFVLEQVLSNTEDKFEYQIWNITSEAGQNVDHIHGVQRFEPLPDGATRFEWTYKVKPSSGLKRPFVQRFVNRNIEPMLSGALSQLHEQAVREAETG